MASTSYKTIVRRGQEITMPTKVYKTLIDNGYSITAILNKNTGEISTVQLTHFKKYAGTLKSYMNVTAFKDHNPANFRKSNLIFN